MHENGDHGPFFLGTIHTASSHRVFGKSLIPKIWVTVNITASKGFGHAHVKKQSRYFRSIRASNQFAWQGYRRSCDHRWCGREPSFNNTELCRNIGCCHRKDTDLCKIMDREPYGDCKSRSIRARQGGIDKLPQDGYPGDKATPEAKKKFQEAVLR